MKKLDFIVFTPEGKKYEEKCDLVQVHGDKYFLGISAGQSLLISDVIVSKLIITNDGVSTPCAVGNGVLSVENDTLKLMVNSFEKVNEIDLKRAQESKRRAEERLKNLENSVDIIRAKASLERALNRINIVSNDNI